MRTAWFAVVLAVTLLGAAGMAAANPADSLVAAWLFDEGIGANVRDSSGLGHNGVFHNPKWARGKYGFAVDIIPGEGSYVEVESTPALSPSSEMTITAWIYLNRLTGTDEVCLSWPADGCQLFNSRIIQAGTYDPGRLAYGIEDNHYRLLFEFGNFIFQVGPNANPNSVSIPMADVMRAGEWIHIAGVYTGDRIKLYINGELVASEASSGNIVQPPQNRLFIGTKSPQAPSGDTWNGRLDEVAIFNKALTADEIKQVMQGISRLL